jgi:hypothetical protein
VVSSMPKILVSALDRGGGPQDRTMVVQLWVGYIARPAEH